jgi:hypothetical protein
VDAAGLARADGAVAADCAEAIRVEPSREPESGGAVVCGVPALDRGAPEALGEWSVDQPLPDGGLQRGVAPPLCSPCGFGFDRIGLS